MIFFDKINTDKILGGKYTWVKFLKELFLGAVSALGAYYYKNPKELEKHKELLKENTKNGIEKLTAYINEKTQELEAKAQEEKDVAREKLEELTSSEEVETVEETSLN